MLLGAPGLTTRSKRLLSTPWSAISRLPHISREFKKDISSVHSEKIQQDSNSKDKDCFSATFYYELLDVDLQNRILRRIVN